MTIVASAVWLLAPSSWNSNVITSTPISKEVSYHPSVALAVDGDGLTNDAIEKERLNNAGCPKFRPNTIFFQLQFLLVNLIWVSVIANTAVLFVYLAIHTEVRLITYDGVSSKHSASTRRCL